MAEVKVEVYDAATSSKVFTFGEGGWKIYGELEGLNNLASNINTVNSSSSIGTILTFSNISNRILTINTVNVETKDRNKIRNDIVNNLKPGLIEYYLMITYAGKTRMLKKCWITNYNVYSGNINGFIKATFSFTALDPTYYAENYKELFSDGSASVYNGSTAPALPIFEISGAADGDYIQFSDEKITIKAQEGKPIPDLIVLDFENFTFSDVSCLTFSNDANRFTLPFGTINARDSASANVHLKFRERFYGM